MGGETPISYMAISRYARDNGITGNEFRVFHRLMTAVDAEWMAYRDEKKDT